MNSTAPYRSSRGLIAIVVAASVVGLLVMVYVGRLLVLQMFATEGDVPSASTLALPSGSEITSETSECASGGCWSLFAVTPPPGTSVDDLAVELGVTPNECVMGSFLDPRSVSLSAESRGEQLLVRADYWSSGCSVNW